MQYGQILRKATILRDSKPTLIEILGMLGLKSSLLFCLDSGDKNSVQNVGSDDNAWLDTSGVNKHFALGTGTGTTTRNAQFYGVPGRLSEEDYWSSPRGGVAGDNVCFTRSGDTFDDGFHQNNGIFSAMFVSDPTQISATGNTVLFSNQNGLGATADNGVAVWINSSGGTLNLITDVGTGAADSQTTSLTGSSRRNTIRFAGVSYTEAGPTAVLTLDHLTSSTTTTASVNVTAPGSLPTLGCTGTASGEGLTIPTKYFMAAMWSVTRTNAEFQLIREMLKQYRFPSMV